MKRSVCIFLIVFSILPALDRQLTASGKMLNENNLQTKYETEKPPMFPLQTGISRYPNQTKWTELKSSRNDVEQIKVLLTGGRNKILAGNIHTLLDKQAAKKVF